jgi:hypothetical protein
MRNSYPPTALLEGPRSHPLARKSSAMLHPSKFSGGGGGSLDFITVEQTEASEEGQEASRSIERDDDAAASAPAPSAGRWRRPWRPGAAGSLRGPPCGCRAPGLGTCGRA